MSGDAASLPCPICLHTGVFNTAQSLRDRLIYVSTHNIVCPICQEEVTGLDKLTIHLFSHVSIIPFKKGLQNRELDIKQLHTNEKQLTVVEKQKKCRAKNKPSTSTSCAPVKFVKIYPKLPVVALNTMPVISSDNVVANPLFISSTIKNETSLMQSANKCNICGVQFVNEGILKMHNSIIHNFEDKDNSVTKYNCHLCSKNFKMRGSLMVHLRVAHYGFTHKNKTNSNTEESFNKNDGTNVPNVEEKPTEYLRTDGKQWQCDVCNKFFTTKYFLKKHKRLHTGETPYACTQCNKTFTFQQSFHKHLLYHNDDKPHVCNFCGRAFKELSTLHNHQRIHTGEKPFACETCGKCFRQRVSYLVHRRIHTGAMPYKCTACEKSFRYKVSQRTHKCQAQPPGAVVRKSTDLVEKLKKINSDHDNTNDTIKKTDHSQKPNYVEVSEANAELVRNSAQLSLEDLESENFSIISNCVSGNSSEGTIVKNKMIAIQEHNMQNDKGYDSNLEELIDSIPIDEKNIPSPSDILKNLCLSNEDDFLHILE
ncbi:zinc finger protein 33A [Colias croceus]|uniref:zinc finger protein 33A n=1 Tax=Colias crocea TaxID=72248 RepID=UPI001E27E7E8|nr:zinc finger protein 33A [Colias croceus]